MQPGCATYVLGSPYPYLGNQMSGQTTLADGPSPNLLSFARRLARAALPTPVVDRRSLKRQLFFAEPALLIPMSRDQEPLGEPLQAVTRDMSLPSGLGLIVEESPKHTLYSVQFTVAERDCNLLAELKWHQPMGPFHCVGLRALQRLDEPTCETDVGDH